MNEVTVVDRDCEDILEPKGEWIVWRVYYDDLGNPCGSRLFRKSDGSLISEKGICPPIAAV